MSDPDAYAGSEAEVLLTKTEFQPVSRELVRSYAPDEAPDAWYPGDFILTHGDSLVSRVIRFGERLRVHGADRIYTFWNHAALVVSEDGGLIEALGRGVVSTNASNYKAREYTLVRVDASPEDRAEAVDFAGWCVKNRDDYGYLTIASIAFTLLTGAKFSFYIDGTEICSGLVARAEERTKAIFGRDASHITPADLAKYYQVPLPAWAVTQVNGRQKLTAQGRRA